MSWEIVKNGEMIGEITMLDDSGYWLEGRQV